MKSPKTVKPDPAKALTGIGGFDEITRGGLPRGRTTLLEGGPGCGKTIMALQTLVNGARLHREPGIFVAFEESAARIIANAGSFGWDLEELKKKKLFFLDAQPSTDLYQSGSFDLGGMLAALGAKAAEIKARRIVFDAVDVVLALLNDPMAERREVYRLHEWLLAQELTAIITYKTGLDEQERRGVGLPELGFMQFMVDCEVSLKHEMVHGVSHRNLRVVKYRGSGFSENASPMVIGSRGLELAGGANQGLVEAKVTDDRVSSGVDRLDAMLGGGYYRGACVLVTGFSGTAKSTLAGAFAEAACVRGERTLFVSFDSDAHEIVRNLGSVKIRLSRYVKQKRLLIYPARTTDGSSEVHLMRIKDLVREHEAQCLVVDRVALGISDNEGVAHGVIQRLIDWTKARGITLLCTKLLDQPGRKIEGTALQFSAVADTWIHLDFLVRAGERNRRLSIIKSRGTGHSNQMRELILSDDGVTLGGKASKRTHDDARSAGRARKPRGGKGT